jgi:cell division protein FtsQ
MIQQIYVNTKKEIELYATIGNHKIVFGNSEDIPEKFNKLKMFYKEGLNSIDAWNKYSIVNLKYKNQVVCTKK